MDALPALILGYSRNVNVTSLINQIAGRLTDKIYLSVDGAKDSATRVIQEKMVVECKDIASRAGAKLIVWHRKVNLGVGVAVPRGIDWFFANEPAGVIIEDDLEISDDFFKFVSQNIKLVDVSSSISMLSGSRFFGEFLTGSAVFSKYPMIWGWATNRSCWSLLRLAYSENPKFPRLLPRTSKEGFWSTGSFKANTGIIDTWDLPLVDMMNVTNQYCLLPPTNLVTNVGVDEFAVHTRSKVFPIGAARETLPDSYKLEISYMEEIADGYDSLMDEQVYGIRARHLLSPIKLRFESNMKRRRKVKSLRNRIESVPLP